MFLGGARDACSPQQRCSLSLWPPASCFLPGCSPFVLLTINGMAPSIVSAGTAAGCHSTEYFPLAISPLCKRPGKQGEPLSPGCILCLAPSASTVPPVPQSRVTLATGVLPLYVSGRDTE